MPARRRPDPDADEAPGEDGDEIDEARPFARRRAGRPVRRHGRPAPQPWSATADEEDDEPPSDPVELEDGPGLFHRPKRPVFYRARDAWWFEPLVALMIIVVLLAGLYAYTQNWPPMYVVQSSSMQHGANDAVGLINTGDLVLAQATNPSSVVPYVVGMQTGYTTYGEYGDVLLYHPNGDTAPAPIIHRAIVYLEYNANGTYNAPDLNGLPCGGVATRAYLAPTMSGCGTVGLHGTLELFHVGWQSVTVNLTLADLGHHSGFVTMGDNNINPGTRTGDQDQPGLSSLVAPAWVVGVARGMLPWVGSLKLLLGGDASEVPSQSWAFLGISLAGIFLLGALIHFGLRAEGIEDDRRKALEEEAAQEEPEHPSRFRGVKAWFSRSETEDDYDTEEPSPPPRSERKRGRSPSGGRPRPAVRRGETPAKRSRHSRPPGGDADL
jgi:signal peptidase